MGNGTGSANILVGDMVFVGGNFQESGGGAREVPQTGDGKDSQVARGWELEKRVSGECAQRSSNTDTDDVH